jgi:hypothetical protein
LIERLASAAPFVYSTRGTSQVSKKSRELRDRIKSGDEALFRQIAHHLGKLVSDGLFPGFFGGDISLVPVPGHTPLAPGAISTTLRIARALADCGLGSGVSPLLTRVKPVQKSAFAAPHERPRARDHYDSMAVTSSLLVPRKIMLIDDVVTRGATLLGAASRIAAELPGAEILGFVLVRAVTDGEIATIRDPCVGTIELKDGESLRRP